MAPKDKIVGTTDAEIKLNSKELSFFVFKKGCDDMLNIIKEKIVIPVIEFKKTLQQTCREYDISSGLLSRWIEKYKAEGISGLENKRKPGNPMAKYFTTKKFNSKEEELEYENMRLKIENERLKKGYIVKGDGSIVVFKK